MERDFDKEYREWLRDVWCFFTCADCARGIIQSGISELHTTEPDLKHEKWGESWTCALEKFKESEVQIHFI